MTIQQALDQRIPRVRLPHWADPNAYLRLPLLADGMHGPWAELYDDRCQLEVIVCRPGSQKIFIMGDGDDRYERYDAMPSPYELDTKNFAMSFVET